MSDKVVSVAEMARVVGLSRQRFHQLMREGVFPPPVYDVETHRPHYTEELQTVCVSVREKNTGINGRVVLFYARRVGAVPKQHVNTQRPTVQKHSDLIDGLRGLGLVAVTEQQVDAAMKEVYPNGTAGVGEADILRAVFVDLMRRDSGVNERSKY